MYETGKGRIKETNFHRAILRHEWAKHRLKVAAAGGENRFVYRDDSAI